MSSAHNAWANLLEAHVSSATNMDGVLFAHGTTVPTDATAGYAKGCLFIDSDATTIDTIWYMNIGTSDSCNFDVCVNT